MNFEPQDWLLLTAGASVIGSAVVAFVGAFLFRQYGRPWYRARAIQREKDAMPQIDYGRVRARNPQVSLRALHDQEIARLESRRLKLVIGGSSRRVS